MRKVTGQQDSVSARGMGKETLIGIYADLEILDSEHF